jgi:predicted membrane-bound dolichyl-phosphate-mannose-protein mannosyltransferase
MKALIRQSCDAMFLRRALLADAAASAATGLLLALGAQHLTDLLGLPVALMRYVGMSLLPFAAIVLLIGLRANPPRAAVLAIIAYNALWAIDSLVLLASGLVHPTLLGAAFVIAQATIVGAFALLQWIGLKRLGQHRAL